MKKFTALFSSSKLTLVLLAIFGVAIAAATFIENDFGTESARKLVYNARWFELLLVVGCLNIIGLTLRFKLYSWKKFSVLSFHLAFILIIIGAGITRYFGYEGSIAIREGQTTNSWLSTENYVEVKANNTSGVQVYRYPLLLAPASNNRFSRRLHVGDEHVKITLEEYLPHARKELVPDNTGSPWAHVVTTSSAGRQDIILQPGDVLQTSRYALEFIANMNEMIDPDATYVIDLDGRLHIKAPYEIKRLIMGNENETVLPAGRMHSLLPASIHYLQGQALVLKQYLPLANLAASAVSEAEASSLSALKFSINKGGRQYPITVFTQKGQQGRYTQHTIDGVEVSVSYGSELRSLPFQLRLNDFILKRYPGSDSPSWYESNVQLLDSQKGVDRAERVYMNHILKHRGYRFYQSSYDLDEMGTVLSINRDGIGTFISYLGYLLMGIGMLLSLFNKNTRFMKLFTGKLGATLVKSLLLLFTLATASQLKAQVADSLPIIPKAHAKAFGAIRVQDNGGRIEPINTLASEVLRKVSRAEQHKGQSPEQVLLGMLAYPEQWQHEKMIRANHERLQNLLGIEGKKAAFTDFFIGDRYGGYNLRPYVEEANRKKPAYRSKFDNELIRTDERLNISYLIYSGAVFRVFPAPNDSTNTWYSPLSAAHAFSGEDSVFTAHFFNYYLQEVRKSVVSGDWSLPDDMLKGLDIFQATYGKEVLPSGTRMQAEAFYNNADLFKRITYLYLLIGMLLLLAQLIQVFLPSLRMKSLFVSGFYIILLAFALHTLALALRWYIAGHAPWSNGYEALTFIAWATVLAGLSFYRKADVSISATAVLAALILQTAHLSWMDPQITNLVPVLQSYWLVIHVAVITASYGFLGLGALLAVINLLLMFFQSPDNRERTNLKINQIQGVVEMTLIAGLYLLSIGTFLGGVWANESWGRYWAWDPKETWALVTILVYAVVLHLRLVPGLKGRVLFNICSLISFASVIMTYFGVNYYLSGLHSYAAGDPLPVPPVIYYSIAVVVIISVLAVWNQSRMQKVYKED